jgi:hypothetical protein
MLLYNIAWTECFQQLQYDALFLCVQSTRLCCAVPSPTAHATVLCRHLQNPQHQTPCPSYV